MTLTELLNSAKRHLILISVGVALTFILAWWVSMMAVAYTSQVNVILLGPVDKNTSELSTSTQSLVDAAGIVSALINGPPSGNQPVSADVSLLGQGIYSGYSIRQPNGGGQWQYSFDQPILDIQATGSTEGEAREHLTLALQRVNDELDLIQSKENVDANARIRTRLSPSTPSLYRAQGSRLRAAGMVVVLGLASTASLSVLIDSRKLRFASRHLLTAKRGAHGTA